MTYRALLKAIREATGETQAEFADRVGLSYHTVRGWERGKRPTVLMHLEVLIREQAKHNLPSITITTPPARAHTPEPHPPHSHPQG